MHVFRSIAFASALSGLVAGSAVTAVQHLETAPLIFEAETYEAAAEVTGNVHDHGAGNAVGSHRHDEKVGSWQPRDGLERMAFTFLANVLSAIG